MNQPNEPELHADPILGLKIRLDCLARNNFESLRQRRAFSVSNLFVLMKRSLEPGFLENKGDSLLTLDHHWYCTRIEIRLKLAHHTVVLAQSSVVLNATNVFKSSKNAFI
jgi:hypothetical protein